MAIIVRAIRKFKVSYVWRLEIEFLTVEVFRRKTE
jgi:hypothetical protein